MTTALNLARRPCRNERLPTLALAVCLALLAILSLRHALAARDLRPGGAGDVEGQVVGLEKEIARLHRETAALGRVDPPAGKLKEWAVIKDLADRRAFSWTGLFAALERSLPPGVRIVSVTPSSGKGDLVLTLSAVGRGIDDALALPKALVAQGEFADAFLASYAERQDGVDISCSVRYLGAAPNGGGR